MAKKIISIVIILLIALAGFINTRPDEFSVTRSATINAPAAKIFEQVNNLKKWENWSPWAKLDPSAKTTFEGPDAGVGAIMRWDGNMDVGAGSMTITDSKPDELIAFQLDFLKPMEGTNTAEFTFKPEGERTMVNWTMSGKNNFIAKAMGLFIDCEKMVGEQFDKGLANIKAVVEAK